MMLRAARERRTPPTIGAVITAPRSGSKAPVRTPKRLNKVKIRCALVFACISFSGGLKKSAIPKALIMLSRNEIIACKTVFNLADNGLLFS